MPTSNNPIKFIPCSKSAYDNLQVKDEDTIYFITDEYRIYVGSNEYTKSLVTLQDAPTSSTVGVDGKLYYYAENHSLYTVHKVSANSYSWSQIANFSDISNLMSYTPHVNTSSEISALHEGQLFRYQDEIGIKTEDDYILLAKKSIVPSRTSQLNNDSGFEIAQTSIPEVRTTEYQSTYIPDLTDTVFTNLTIGQYFWFEREENPHFCVKTASDDWKYTWWTADYISSLDIPTATSELTNDSGFLTAHQDISGKEDKSNKVTSLSAQSTDTQYPSAKCVYDELSTRISHMPSFFVGTTDKPATEVGDDVQAYFVGDRYVNNTTGGLWVCSSVALDETQTPAIYNYGWTYVDLLINTSGKMNLIDGIPYDSVNHWPDTSTTQFGTMMPGQIFQSSESPAGQPRYWVKFRTAASSYSFDAAELLTRSQIYDKADVETGSITTSYAWYTDPVDDYTITGNYTIIGDTCFVRATAKCVSGWERVYYSLPVACLDSSATIALAGGNNYTIATGTLDNTSVLEIKQLGSQYMAGDTIQFTLIYRCL